MIIGGHDELQRLVVLYRCHMIPLHIKSLSINLTPTFPCEGCQQNGGLAAVMRRIQEGLNHLEKLVFGDWWYHHGEWQTLNLQHFSFSVEVSGVSIQRHLFKRCTWHWVSCGGVQWYKRGWRGSDGVYSGRLYSYWDRHQSDQIEALYIKPKKVTYPNSTLKEFSKTFSSAHI